MGTKSFNNYADLITFTRASGATLLDSDGLLKRAGHNLLTYSEQFDNGWTAASSSITANDTTAPDGKSTADSLILNNSNSVHYIYKSVGVLQSSVSYTYSLYVKANTRDYAYIKIQGGSTPHYGILVNLTNGAIEETKSNGSFTNTSTNVTAVVSGWYQVSISFTSLPSQIHYIMATPGVVSPPSYNSYGDQVFLGDATAIYVWGAHLYRSDMPMVPNRNSGWTAETTYYPTTSAAYEAPRIEYDADGNRLGLLVEEQRTNITNYSEDFSNAAWLKSGISVETDNIVAPDGALYNDNTIRENSSNSEHIVYNGNSTLGTNATFTMSVYAKNGVISPRRYIGLRNNSATTGAMAVFDLQEGTVADTNASGNYSVVSTSIENVGNGWYRCSVTMSDGGDGYRAMRIQTVNSATPTYNSIRSVVYQGDGVSTLIIWGAQMEIDAFPTSYIPTSGSTATRAADVASIPVSAFGYNQREGTVFVEGGLYEQTAINLRVIGGSPNRWLYVNSPDSNAPFKYFDGTNNIDITNANALSFKAAVAVTESSVTGSVNGSVASGGAHNGTLLDVTSLELLSNNNGHIKSIKYYPRRLSNDQLQELTQ